MVDYVLKLTRDPASVESDDVDQLRRQGFSDRAILDICQVTAYYAYVNRMAEGLGVELEDFWTDEDLVLTREEFEERGGGRRRGRGT